MLLLLCWKKIRLFQQKLNANMLGQSTQFVDKETYDFAVVHKLVYDG